MARKCGIEFAVPFPLVIVSAVFIGYLVGSHPLGADRTPWRALVSELRVRSADRAEAQR